MSNLTKPSIWLIIFIVGLPQLSETIYSPALPKIADALYASERMVELTFTLFLFGFSVGTLFFGILSDRLGRKPCVQIGLFIFALGCIGCYYSTNIYVLLIARFVQAFGGSIGSVLGQAICRDAYQGPSLGKAYASISSALAIFPALGPIVGGIITEHSSWESVFLALIVFTMILSGFVYKRLPETHLKRSLERIVLHRLIWQLAKDRKILALGFIVGACNGITFSYFAEGSFIFIETLNISPTLYGMTFIFVSLSTMLGGFYSRYLQVKMHSANIMKVGVCIILIASTVMSLTALGYTIGWWNHKSVMALLFVISQMLIMFGICMATSNALALALVKYQSCIGAASSLFGCFYYSLISLFTLGMSLLHNGSINMMPLYFLLIALAMLLVTSRFQRISH